MSALRRPAIVDYYPAKPSLLVFSANHPDSLHRVIGNVENYYSQHRPLLNDLAYTVNVRRQHLLHRAFSVTDGSLPWEVSPATTCEVPQRPVFVFTGQGAQWPQMGKELMEDFPTFLQDIRSMDETLGKLDPPPPWTIESMFSKCASFRKIANYIDELLQPETISSLDKPEFSQPLCMAVQVALVNLLRVWGVLPAAAVGHSSGEIAAAYAAGCLTQREAITLAYYRGLATEKQKRRGGMAAVGLGRTEVVTFLTPGLTIACENSATNVTVSGDEEELESFINAINKSQSDVLARRLRVQRAYHCCNVSYR